MGHGSWGLPWIPRACLQFTRSPIPKYEERPNVTSASRHVISRHGLERLGTGLHWAMLSKVSIAPLLSNELWYLVKNRSPLEPIYGTRSSGVHEGSGVQAACKFLRSAHPEIIVWPRSTSMEANCFFEYED